MRVRFHSCGTVVNPVYSIAGGIQMKKELTNRQRQAIETKEHIRESAWELFQSADIEQVTIAQICAAAHVSAGNFYHYYHSKEELFFENYPLLDEYVSNEFQAKNFKSNVDAIKDLICHEVAGAGRIGPHILAQMLRIQLKQDERYPYMIDDSRPFHICLKGLAQAGIDEGEFHPSYTAEEITGTILRLSRGIGFDWAIRNGTYPINQQVENDLDLLLRSFAFPKSIFENS